jgi:hypothetical protein
MSSSVALAASRSLGDVAVLRRARSTSRPRAFSARADASGARSRSSPSSSSRRSFALGLPGAFALGLLPLPPAVRAEVLTPAGYDDPAFDPSGWNRLVSAGPGTLGCAYALDWPSGWCALSDVASARVVGVDASFKNPLDEASTLAVFVSDAGPGVASVADRGTLDAVAALRADSAPRQQCVGKRRRRTDVGDAGRTAQTYDVETKVGGGTAGRFGSAVELVGITVYGGREYLVRATASAAAWPAEKARLRRAVESFRILDAC